MACHAYTWKQVVGTPLFAENELALQVGEGADAVTVIRTPARYSSFEAASAGWATDPPPRWVSTPRSTWAHRRPRREPHCTSLTTRSSPRSAT